MSTLAYKKKILKQVNSYGLAGAVNDEALDAIVAYLVEQKSEENLHALLELCQRDRPPSGDVTRSVVEAAVCQLQGRGEGVELVAVINAFDVPKISYDPVGRKMFADPAPRTLFAEAPAKNRLYLDRLQLITQRMRRNKFFQQNQQVLAGFHDQPSAQLTDLQSLKGVEGQQRFVMGCVARSEDGVKLVLEDATGSVPLDISAAQWPAGIFTDNCVVIAQGVLSLDGVFHAQQLGLPPVELREDLAEASKRLNFFGGPTLSSEALTALGAAEASGAHREDRIIVAANVWLDRKETFDRLGQLLNGFQSVAIIPPLFVLMGNFHSKAPAVAGCMSASQRAGAGPGVDLQSLKQGFTALADLIAKFPRIRAESRFVFVPGPGDPSPSDTLPQPPLPNYLTEDVLRVCPNAVFASNPCRIRYLSQQVVVFRYDILKRLRRRCLLPISGGEPSTPEAMWQHLTLTLLQQSHLCPLPLLHQPIYWQYDHALSLYPLPHAVIVADMSPQAAHTHKGCTVFTPGSFVDGFFAAYVPGQQAVELSELPKEGVEYGDAVEGEEEAYEDQEEEAGMAPDIPLDTAADAAGTAGGSSGQDADMGLTGLQRALERGEDELDGEVHAEDVGVGLDDAVREADMEVEGWAGVGGAGSDREEVVEEQLEAVSEAAEGLVGDEPQEELVEEVAEEEEVGEVVEEEEEVGGRRRKVARIENDGGGGGEVAGGVDAVEDDLAQEVDQLELEEGGGGGGAEAAWGCCVWW